VQGRLELADRLASLEMKRRFFQSVGEKRKIAPTGNGQVGRTGTLLFGAVRFTRDRRLFFFLQVSPSGTGKGREPLPA